MQHRSGNILPLALIMTFTILLASIGIGAVVLEGSQRAQITDQSVSAYYMADSGIERQLYAVRKQNQSLNDLALLGGQYVHGGSWISTAALEQATFKKISYISTSSFAVIDLFDPDNLTIPSGITRMQIIWSTDPACVPASTMEVSYGYWKLEGGVPTLPDDTTYVVLPKNGSGSLLVDGLDPSSSYRIRLRAFDCPAVNVSVSVFDAQNQPKSFPGDVALGAEGTYGKATQKIAVVMPKLDVLSGIFGYVIFSECSLVKDPNQPQICPP